MGGVGWRGEGGEPGAGAGGVAEADDPGGVPARHHCSFLRVIAAAADWFG